MLNVFYQLSARHDRAPSENAEKHGRSPLRGPFCHFAGRVGPGTFDHRREPREQNSDHLLSSPTSPLSSPTSASFGRHRARADATLHCRNRAETVLEARSETTIDTDTRLRIVRRLPECLGGIATVLFSSSHCQQVAQGALFAPRSLNIALLSIS